MRISDWRSDVCSSDLEDPHVRRAALEALVHYPDMNTLETVIRLRHKVPEIDDHLVYTARLCMRNLVREPALMAQASVRKWTGKDAGALRGVMTGIHRSEALRVGTERVST